MPLSKKERARTFLSSDPERERASARSLILFLSQKPSDDNHNNNNNKTHNRLKNISIFSHLLFAALLAALANPPL